jgi:hypothetical protein
MTQALDEYNELEEAKQREASNVAVTFKEYAHWWYIPQDLKPQKPELLLLDICTGTSALKAIWGKEPFRDMSSFAKLRFSRTTQGAIKYLEAKPKAVIISHLATINYNRLCSKLEEYVKNGGTTIFLGT